LAALFAFALFTSAASALYAGYEARGLNADGSFYLLGALSHGGLNFIEPARKTVQFLQQSLVFAAFRLGQTDLLAYGRLLTLGMQGWPVMLTAASWFALPRGERNWMLGPLLNLAVVIPATNFIDIGEGIIASCLMWLLFFLIEFRMNSAMSSLLTVLLAAACFYLHEAAFPFMVGIALLAAGRLGSARGFSRVCLVLVSLLALASSLHLLYFVVFPRAPAERLYFLTGALFEFLAYVGPEGIGFNLQALAAIAVGLCLLVTYGLQRKDPRLCAQRLRLACLAAAIASGVFLALFLTLPEWVLLPHPYFAARSLPITATTVMAAATHLLRRSGQRPTELAPPPIRWLLAIVIAMQLGAQSMMTMHWAAYREDLAKFVASHEGVIDWPTANRALNPHQTYFRTHFLRAWSLQPLSIVLAPDGKVGSIVQPISWAAFNSTDPSSLPLCARGLDWSTYLHAADIPQARAQGRCLI
jgi:hypothetical protein